MYQELQKNIAAGNIAAVYLFCGKERFLLEDTVNVLLKNFSGGQDISAAFNIERLDGNQVSLPEVVNLANTVPFFSAKKLVIVDNAAWFANAKSSDTAKEESQEDTPKAKDQAGIDQLLAYIASPSPSTCLVFLAGEKVNKVKKLTKAINKQGVIAEFSPLKGVLALKWLDGLLKQKQVAMSAAGKEQLLLAGDYNCAIINQEVDKLICYVGPEKEITLEAVQAVVCNNTTATIFNLVDAVSMGQLEKSLQYLENVLLLESEFMLVPILSNHFTMMFLCKNMKSRGYNLKEIMAETGRNHPFVIEKALKQGQKYSEEMLKKILEILLQADIKSKSGISTARVAVETAIIQICMLST